MTLYRVICAVNSLNERADQVVLYVMCKERITNKYILSEIEREGKIEKEMEECNERGFEVLFIRVKGMHGIEQISMIWYMGG